MGMVRSVLLVTVGAAVGGALLLAHRVSQDTGKGLADSFAEVPGEAQRLFQDLKVRADDAMARGKEAYRQKEAEMEDHLRNVAQGQ
jgi:hypothetical protein